MPKWDPPVNPVHPLFGARPEPLPRYRPPRYKLTREETRQVILLRYRHGLSITQVADELGICTNTVLAVQKRLGERKAISIDKIRAIYRLKHENGMSDSEIAQELEVSRSTVEKYLQFETPEEERRYVKAIENL